MKKESKLSKKEQKTLSVLLADASADWIELDWENYNLEITKAFLLGRKYQKKIEDAKRKKKA